VEGVLLVDLDHGQLAQLGGDSVRRAGDLLLLLEQGLAGGEPLLFGNDLYGLLDSAALAAKMSAGTG
jgi:hypothetical protein